MNKLSAKKKLIGMILFPAFLTSAATVSAGESDHSHGGDVAQPEGYASEHHEGAVWRSTYDLGNHCWRTGYWNEEEHKNIEGCDGYEKVAEAEPEPEPAPAPVPAPETKSFAADAFFDFDSAQLKPEGRAELDDLANALQTVSYEAVVVVGHTDRIGSPAYNQRLSERRADAVKSYLMSKGIDGSRIYASGKGEENPVTGSACNGKSGQALKACLAPDRRVDIEVSGVR